MLLCLYIDIEVGRHTSIVRGKEAAVDGGVRIGNRIAGVRPPGMPLNDKVDVELFFYAEGGDQLERVMLVPA